MDLLKTLPIGLYLEQPITWLHRLDPRVKLAWLVSILISPILANAAWRFFVVGFLILLTLLAAIPVRVWRQQMGLLLFLCTLMLVLTSVLPDGLAISYQSPVPIAETLKEIEPFPDQFPPDAFDLPQPTGYRYVVIDQGPLRVTQRSLELGIRVSTLIFTLIYGTNLFLLTTAAEEVTVALEVLMRPLRTLRVPVTEIALTVTLALRFIPLVLEETQNLIRSVQTRAIDWKKLGFRGSAQVWLAVVERLLKNLLLRAEQTAAAMAVRGFTTPNTHRVKWSHLQLRSVDWIALAVLVGFWYARIVWGGEG
ncbi:CbiQ family ECF transporter T component [Oscillatoria sp. CS-180]|uniref:energy-coupling factor transporter transmembrane component T family protein n=1 Tax=Oscillatoria sp. CS-180 TaxID=3021720 RepID=UPI00232BBC0C|nr:CbiQ family ECF transporter T component [Oscillatoria sp. CS-180]MDB9528810.1 CbiQ family ECF transporter T component [Oscillatoria sp. CS-180]